MASTSLAYQLSLAVVSAANSTGKLKLDSTVVKFVADQLEVVLRLGDAARNPQVVAGALAQKGLSFAGLMPFDSARCGGAVASLFLAVPAAVASMIVAVPTGGATVALAAADALAAWAAYCETQKECRTYIDGFMEDGASMMRALQEGLQDMAMQNADVSAAFGMQ